MQNITVRRILSEHYGEDIKALAIRGLASREGGYVLAVDFDGTLCKDAWPAIGEPNHETINVVKRLRELGIQVILWTCREAYSLYEAVQWCKQEHGLTFDAVNANVQIRMDQYDTDPRKIGYDELWDDKATPTFKGMFGRCWM